MRLRKISLIILLLLSVGIGQAAAHGIGTPVKINVPAAPYLLSIWTDPDPLRVDETHVTVAVMKPETRAPIVGGVQVLVQLYAPSDPTVSQTAVALADNSVNRLLYTAIFDDLPEPGQWQGVISVVGPNGPGEDIPFTIEISPPEPVNWLRWGIIGLVILVFGWFMRAARQTVSRRQPPKRRNRSTRGAE